MTKATAIERMADEMGLSKDVASRGLNALLASIVEALGKGEKVSLRGLGTFRVHPRPSRSGTNNITGQPYNVPPSHVVKFRASEELKQLVGSIALSLVMLVCGTASAAMVNFEWNASMGEVVGYRLYQGPESGTYDASKTATIQGNITSGSMDLDPAGSHYVAAKAYDSGNRESVFSNEILCHPVIVSAATGGTINPSGTFFAQDGDAIAFTLSPDKDYKVASVTVNGSLLAGDLVRKVTVRERSVVLARFEPIAPPSAPTDLHLQVLRQIASDVARIASAVDPIAGE